MSDDANESAPGWDAIDAALEAVYGAQEPLHWGCIVPYESGGEDPLHGISAYRSPREQLHFHFVTYGFSELWEKESDDPEQSGYGFELTFRLTCRPKDDPPNWALSFLQNLGRYVFETGNRFGAGHTMPLNGPIAQKMPTEICAVSFIVDPELGEIETPNGRVTFLQVVGLTQDELSAAQSWNASSLMELMAEKDPLLITDVRRQSHLKEPEFAQVVATRTHEEGASGTALYCEHGACQFSGRECRLILGANSAEDLGLRLKGRLPYGRDFSVITQDVVIQFEAGEAWSWEPGEGEVTFVVPPDLTPSLVSLLKPVAGRYQSPDLPGLTVVIEKTEIKDVDGNTLDIVG